MTNKLICSVGFITAIAIFIIAGCEKGPQFREFTHPAPKPTGLSPASGYPTTNITITGSDFDTLTGAVKVWFGGIQATSIVSSNGNQIVVQVPANAVSGKVSLQVWTTKLDSVGTYTVIAAPVINSVASKNAQTNVAFPGDTLYLKGLRFGTDATKAVIKVSGTTATNVPFYNDTLIKAIAPAGFSSGNVTLTIGGLTLTATPAIINPNAPGNITPYFLSNTGDTTKGGGFTTSTALVSNRWGTLAAPWVTNTATKNKSGVGGYSKDAPSGGLAGTICWETWSNTPITDGIIYQTTSMPLPAGSYTLSVKYYSEVQQNSTVHLAVATGSSGIPTLANLSSALASVALANPSNVGATTPNVTETKTLNFTVSSSQVVSIGFLANLAWGNGTANPGCYIRVDWIKLVKN
ncbi:DUF5013 domain-containing protein [Niastella caeni]|uniref:DUF5013 domain-containing protein n=1 Tax=Niastella caeni TaxID=2569763 RepID=A0A4S8HZA0_9BACT|nr:DUF5013 domain-containing protein [Niastella caeni]THU41077.1 DUF5013 domain-containing protein [Niastella caeni]